MGVQYVKDKVFGNCSIMHIPKDSFDAIPNGESGLSIKDPLKLFGMGENQNLIYYGKVS